jgi:hypothetical protein
MNKLVTNRPVYEWAWIKLREFPAMIYRGSASPPATSGAAAAFLISGGVGSVIMMVIHHFSDTSKSTESWVKFLGSWIPGSTSSDPLWGNIGSYAGKETCLLIGWLLSLLILYPLLQGQHLTSYDCAGKRTAQGTATSVWQCLQLKVAPSPSRK